MKNSYPILLKQSALRCFLAGNFFLIPLFVFAFISSAEAQGDEKDKPSLDRKFMVLIAADTADAAIGASNAAAVRDTQEWLDKLFHYQHTSSQGIAPKPVTQVLKGERFHSDTVRRFMGYVAEEAAKQDIVFLFFYFGHGTAPGDISDGFARTETNGFPVLTFSDTDKVPAYSFYKLMEEDHTGLLRMVFINACNSDADPDQDIDILASAPSPGDSTIRVSSPTPKARNYRLFEAEGQFICTSSALGQFSYTFPEQSPFFVSSLKSSYLNFFEHQKKKTDWANFLEDVRKGTRSKATMYKFKNFQKHNGKDSILQQVPVFEGVIDGKSFKSGSVTPLHDDEKEEEKEADTTEETDSEMEEGFEEEPDEDTEEEDSWDFDEPDLPDFNDSDRLAEDFYETNVRDYVRNFFKRVKTVANSSYTVAEPIWTNIGNEFFNNNGARLYQFSGKKRFGKGFYVSNRTVEHYLKSLNKLLMKRTYSRVEMSLIDDVRLSKLTKEGTNLWKGAALITQKFEGFKGSALKYGDTTVKSIEVFLRYLPEESAFEVYFGDTRVKDTYDFKP